jgi:hypothetical protein
VIIEEEFKQALYDVLADLPYVLDVRNAK